LPREDISMRLACCAYSYRDLLTKDEMTMEQFLDACVEMDLDGVELTSYYFPRTDLDYLHHLKRECARRGLHISAGAVGTNFCQADPTARAADVAKTKEWIDYYVVLGAPYIRVFAGGVPEGAVEQHAFEWCVACLKEVTAYGAERGVMVALENHGGITSTADQVDRLVAAAKHDWFGINFDLGNYREPAKEFPQTAPHTVTTHAKVTHRDEAGKRHKVDYVFALGVLKKAGYRGYINIEYEEDDDPRVGVPRFANTLREAMARVG